MTKARQAKVEVSTELHEGGGFTHTLKFTNGQTRVVAFAPEHGLYQQFAAHGAKAKLLASANSADEADKAVEKVDNLVDGFDEGKWSLLGEGKKYSPLVRALAEVKGVSEDDAEAVVKGLSKSQQAKLRATERIATIISRIKAEDGADDGDKLLDGLLGDEEGDDAAPAQRRA